MSNCFKGDYMIRCSGDSRSFKLSKSFLLIRISDDFFFIWRPEVTTCNRIQMSVWKLCELANDSVHNMYYQSKNYWNIHIGWFRVTTELKAREIISFLREIFWNSFFKLVPWHLSLVKSGSVSHVQHFPSSFSYMIG